MDFLVICVTLVALINFGEATKCNDKPHDLEYMEPEGCWFGPEVFNYDAQFECENYIFTKINYAAYKPEGRLCVMDCALKDGDVIKDMKLNRQKFLEQVKKRTHIEYQPWETHVTNAANKCFDLAEKKLATLNAKDFDDTTKCNPVPKSLLHCISGELLVHGPRLEGPPDMFCAKLTEFYKTCEYDF